LLAARVRPEEPEPSDLRPLLRGLVDRELRRERCAGITAPSDAFN
jgi:hypothetical protein